MQRNRCEVFIQALHEGRGHLMNLTPILIGQVDFQSSPDDILRCALPQQLKDTMNQKTTGGTWGNA